MKVVYDTGSDWLTVQGKKCTNCKGKTYDGSAGRQVEATQSNRAYGSASLDGYVYEDKVCLDERSCVSKFKYFLIESQKGMNPPIEGILGMSLKNNFMMSNKAYEVGPLLVDQLAQAKEIPKGEFSFHMQTAAKGNSHVDIGPP